jgi:hypothetical protein
MSSSCSVYYVVPEDLDDFSHPNLFSVPAAAPSLADIKKAFPLPGSYHFRFKRQFKSGFVWADALDDAASVPSFEGVIFAKISRISKTSAAPHDAASEPAEASKVAAKERSKPPQQPPQQQPRQQQPPQQQPRQQQEVRRVDAGWGEDEDWTATPSPAPPPRQPTPPAAVAAPVNDAASDDLFGFLGASSAPAPSGSTMDFFGSGSSSSNQPLPGSSSASVATSSAGPVLDFWGDAGDVFASTPPAEPSPPPRPASGGNNIFAKPPSLAPSTAVGAGAKPKVSIELGAQAAKQFSL